MHGSEWTGVDSREGENEGYFKTVVRFGERLERGGKGRGGVKGSSFTGTVV